MKTRAKTRYQVRPAVMADIPALARMQFEEQKEMLEHMGMTEISMREVARTRDFYRVQIEDKDVKLVVAEDEASKAIVGMGLAPWSPSTMTTWHRRQARSSTFGSTAPVARRTWPRISSRSWQPSSGPTAPIP